MLSLNDVKVMYGRSGITVFNNYKGYNYSMVIGGLLWLWQHCLMREGRPPGPGGQPHREAVGGFRLFLNI